MDVVELPETPDPTTLLARAAWQALPRPGSGPPESTGDIALPPTAVRIADLPVEVGAVADYANVCGFRLDTTVPLTYPHLLGFPLSVWLMTREDFPLDLLGLVHVANRVEVHAPIPVGAHVDVTARMTDPRPHRRGTQFDNLVLVHLDGELAWESASTYLRRGPIPEDVTGGGMEVERSDRDLGRTTDRRTAEDVDPADLPLTGRWRVPADIGRRYAAVSGDAFGFPRAIAHGMWTKASALAGLGGLDLPCTVDVVFRKPVHLPSTIGYATRREPDGWTFGLRGRDGTPHLTGIVSRP